MARGGGELREWRMATWQFARQVFEEQFRALGERGYSLERLETRASYRELHERELRPHFPPEVFFALDELRSEQERAGQERLAAAGT